MIALALVLLLRRALLAGEHTSPRWGSGELSVVALYVVEHFNPTHQPVFAGANLLIPALSARDDCFHTHVCLCT